MSPHDIADLTISPAQTTSTEHRPHALFALSGITLNEIFAPADFARLERTCTIADASPLESFESPGAQDLLAQTEVLITGWGAPPLTDELLDHAANLRAIIHTAGTIKGIVPTSAFDRGIAVSSAAATNAIPVAEYTFACIIMGLKRAEAFRRQYAANPAGNRALPADRAHPVGAFGARVGIIGASHVGRLVATMLRGTGMQVSIYDPYLSEAEALNLGATLADLDTICAQSDVLTIHAPDIPETHHMIGKRQLDLFPDGALLINTARGRLLDHTALLPHVESGRLDAYLEVTDPEPLPEGHPLFSLPNVVLTPHVAGSLGREVHRLGAAAVDEIERYVAGKPLAFGIDKAQLHRMA